MENTAAETSPRLVVPYRRFAIRMAVGILGLLFVGHSVGALRQIGQLRPNGWYVLAGAVVAIGLLCVQAVQCHAVLTTRARHGWKLALLGQVALTYLPFLVFFEAWLGMVGFLAGWCLLLLSPWWAWIAYALVVVAQVLLAILLPVEPSRVVSTVVWTAMLGLVIYGVVRLTAMARDVVEVEIARERERFERDLHDLIGQRLLVIALKCELASRLLTTDREHAGEQLAMVIDVVRQTQADVHAVSHSRRTTSLKAELASARSVLESAGKTCRIDASCGELSARSDEVLVAVVREGVTNVLRHSTANSCQISVEEQSSWVELVLANDGATDERAQANPGGGIGLRNLQSRVAAVGGEFTVRVVGDRFQLAVRLPRNPAG